MGLGKVQVMKNKSVVVGKGENGKGGDYSCNTGQGLFAQADNFFVFFSVPLPTTCFFTLISLMAQISANLDSICLSPSLL